MYIQIELIQGFLFGSAVGTHRIALREQRNIQGECKESAQTKAINKPREENIIQT